MSPRVRRILADVAERAKLTTSDLLGLEKPRTVARARQEAMARIRALSRPDGEPAYSYPAIGEIFGRHHTTIMLGVRQHEKRHGSTRREFPLAMMDHEETRL